MKKGEKPANNLVSTTDFMPSILTVPYIQVGTSVLAFVYSITFSETNAVYALIAPANLAIEKISFQILGFDKSSVTATISKIRAFKLSGHSFQKRYLNFYKRMLLEFYHMSDDKIHSAFSEVAFVSAGSPNPQSLAGHSKQTIFLPARRENLAKTDLTFSDYIDEDLIDSCFEYWANDEGYPVVSPVDPDTAILQARYGKQARYTVVKEFPSIMKMKAIDLYDHLIELFSQGEAKVLEEAKTVIARKMHFSKEELARLSIREFLTSIPPDDQAFNDLYTIHQIEIHQGFKDYERDDSLFHVLPVTNARTVIYSNPKDNTSPNGMIDTFKTSFPFNKPKLRLLMLRGRFMKMHPIGVPFFNNLLWVPLALFDLEKRMVNHDVAYRFNIKSEKLGETVFWRALRTRMVDMIDNFETLETLGDSILKFIITAILYSRFHFRESKMTFLRMKLINNYNLQIKAHNHKIHHLVSATHARISKWFPGLFKGEEKKTLSTSQIPMSMLADVVEALMGAVYLSSNKQLLPVLDFLIRLDIWPERLDSIEVINNCLPVFPGLRSVMKYKANIDYMALYPIKLKDIEVTISYERLFKLAGFNFPTQDLTNDILSMDLQTKIAILEKLLGYTFKDKKNIEVVLERSKHPREFERYEFLGDSVIEYRAVDLIFTVMPHFNKLFEPHDLHKGKIYLLSNQSLSFFTSFFFLDLFVDCKIHSYCSEIRHYAPTSMFGQFLRHEFTSKKILGDIWESLMAALVLDGGLEAFDQLYTRSIMPFVLYLCKFCKYLEGSAKSAAFEIMTKKKLRLEKRGVAGGEFTVSILNEENEEVKSFRDCTEEGAEELCYFFISYSYRESTNC
jgi:dsRNA-specific ribonuclease